MATETNDDVQVAEVEFPEGALVFRTVIHAGSWTSSEGETYNDLNVIENPTETLIRDVAHAHAAGVLEIVQGIDTDDLGAHGVQSQEDGEKAYAEAFEDGRWREGQDQQELVEQEARERGDFGLTVEVAEEGDE